MSLFKSTILAMAIGLLFIPGALAQFGGGFRGNTNNNSVPTQEPFGTTYLGGYQDLGGRWRGTSRGGLGNGYRYSYYSYYPARYLTGQYYEPGDGWRYPVYHDPVSGLNIYYPAAR
jgi:hypothetical protein